MINERRRAEDFNATFQAVNHLKEKGFSNIALITLKSNLEAIRQRNMGFEQGMKDSNLPIHPEQIFELNQATYTEEIRQVAQQIREGKLNSDAILFTTHYLAIAGIKVFREFNLTIPDDVAIISFGEKELFSMLTPSLTCLTQPVEQMADEAISMLLEKIKDPEATVKSCKLPVELKERESTNKKNK